MPPQGHKGAEILFGGKDTFVMSGGVLLLRTGHFKQKQNKKLGMPGLPKCHAIETLLALGPLIVIQVSSQIPAALFSSHPAPNALGP